jgi:hypothetical protein
VAKLVRSIKNQAKNLEYAACNRAARSYSFSRDCTFKHSKVHCTRFSVCTGGTPFYVHEVIDQGGEPIKVQEYFGVGRVTEFRYGIKVRARISKPRNRFPAWRKSILGLLKSLQIRARSVSLCGICGICKFKSSKTMSSSEPKDSQNLAFLTESSCSTSR